MSTRVGHGIAVAALSMAAVVGCAAAPAAPAPSSTPPASSVAPTPSSDVHPVAVQPLAETILPTLSGYRFVPPPQGEAAALATLGQDLPNSDWVEGGLMKTVTRKGAAVGGVIIVRWAPEVALDEAFQTDLLENFARKKAASSRIAGQRVLQVSDARGEGVGAVVWAHELEIVLVWSQDGLRTARAIGHAFLAG